MMIRRKRKTKSIARPLEIGIFTYFGFPCYGAPNGLPRATFMYLISPSAGDFRKTEREAIEKRGEGAKGTFVAETMLSSVAKTSMHEKSILQTGAEGKGWFAFCAACAIYHGLVLQGIEGFPCLVCRSKKGISKQGKTG